MFYEKISCPATRVNVVFFVNTAHIYSNKTEIHKNVLLKIINILG